MGKKRFCIKETCSFVLECCIDKQFYQRYPSHVPKNEYDEEHGCDDDGLLLLCYWGPGACNKSYIDSSAARKRLPVPPKAHGKREKRRDVVRVKENQASLKNEM